MHCHRFFYAHFLYIKECTILVIYTELILIVMIRLNGMMNDFFISFITTKNSIFRQLSSAKNLDKLSSLNEIP